MCHNQPRHLHPPHRQTHRQGLFLGRALHRNLPPHHRWHQNPLFRPEVQTADTNLKVKGTDSVLHTPKRISHLARIC